jgi:hypothetical protein
MGVLSGAGAGLGRRGGVGLVARGGRRDGFVGWVGAVVGVDLGGRKGTFICFRLAGSWAWRCACARRLCVLFY